jgi:hypothetical protein
MFAQRVIRVTTTAAALAAAAGLGACASNPLGNVLGGVLSPSTNGTQVSATIQSVDTRSQVINLTQGNGQYVSAYYDGRTQVIYQNQVYPVSSLEYGDQVLAHLLNQGNNSYYADTVYVTQPVNSNSSRYPNGNVGRYPNDNTSRYPSDNASVQSLSGRVQSIDFNNGLFTVDGGNGVRLTVSMPYRANSQDQNRFNNLRVGDYVRFSGVFVNTSRVELRNFY